MLPLEPKTKSEPSRSERIKVGQLLQRVHRWHSLHRILDKNTGAWRDNKDAVPVLCRALREGTEAEWPARLVAAKMLRFCDIPADRTAEVAAALGNALNSKEIPLPKVWKGRTGRAMTLALLGGCCWILVIVVAVVFLIGRYGVMYDGPGVEIERSAPAWTDTLFACITGMIFPAALAGGFLSLMHDFKQERRINREALRSLAALQLPESVGALALAARGKFETAKIAWQALSTLLPTLTEEHYGQVGANATHELCNLVVNPYLESYAGGNVAAARCEILRALGKVGCGQAVATVEWFINNAIVPELREQAKSILPILLERRERENASSSLLRGSSAPVSDGSKLLRAASYAETTAPELLLRPSIGGSNDVDK